MNAHIERHLNMRFTRGFFTAAGLMTVAFLTGCSVPPRAYAPGDGREEEEYRHAVLPGRRGWPTADVDLPGLDDGSSLENYLQYAALNNPGLEASFEKWKAALARVPQVTALPEPQLTYSHFIEEVETRVGPQERKVALVQRFPWFGKLRLRGEAADEQARVTWQRFQADKLKLFHRVKSAYAEYYHLKRAVAITEENLTLLRHLERVARTKFRTGIASHADVVRAQVELGKLEDRLRALRDLRGPRAAALNAALGRPAGAELPWPDDLPPLEAEISDARLSRLVKTANPELAALRSEIAKHQRNVELAGREYYPDFGLGLSYIDTGGARMPGVSDSGKDPLVFMLSLELPLWRSKYRAAEEQARSNVRRTRKTLTDRMNQIESEVRLTAYELRDARRKEHLFRNTLIPKATESLKTTETAFKAGEADFLSLLDSQRQLLAFELELERARADQLAALGKLEMLVGRELEGEDAEKTGRTAGADQNED